MPIAFGILSALSALHARGILYGPDYLVNAGGLLSVLFEKGETDEGVAHTMAALADSGTPFSILTKGTLLRRDLPLLAELSQVMRDASICGLGQAAPNPVDCVIKYFPHELA